MDDFDRKETKVIPSGGVLVFDGCLVCRLENEFVCFGSAGVPVKVILEKSSSLY